MARIVVKVIRGRRYSYRVEGVAEVEGGKKRTRWTYLGPEGGEPAPSPVRDETRDRILNALERVIERGESDEIPSAGIVAKEAGIGHGTFYRYFKNKEAAIDALMDRMRIPLQEARPNPSVVPANREAARADLAHWIRIAAALPARRAAVIRLGWRRTITNAVQRAARDERRSLAFSNLAAYFRMLDREGLAEIPDATLLAGALLLLIEAPYRALIDRVEVSPAVFEGVVAFVDRAVFGTPARD